MRLFLKLLPNMLHPERLYPQNVVGAILVPIFLWSIGAAGEKAEYVRKMAKVCLNLIRISGQRHSKRIFKDTNKFAIDIHVKG